MVLLPMSRQATVLSRLGIQPGNFAAAPVVLHVAAGHRFSRRSVAAAQGIQQLAVHLQQPGAGLRQDQGLAGWQASIPYGCV